MVESIDEDTAQSEDTLRQFGDEEETDDCKEHRGRAIMLAGHCRLLELTELLELQSSGVRIVHDFDEETREDRQQGAGKQLKEHGMDPVVDMVQDTGSVANAVKRNFVGHASVGVRYGRVGEDRRLVGTILLDFEAETIGNAEQKRRYVHGCYCDLGFAYAAERSANEREVDVDVAKDGQCNGQPDGDSVAGNCEVGVEEEVTDPSEGPGFQRLQLDIPLYVEMDVRR